MAGHETLPQWLAGVAPTCRTRTSRSDGERQDAAPHEVRHVDHPPFWSRRAQVTSICPARVRLLLHLVERVDDRDRAWCGSGPGQACCSSATSEAMSPRAALERWQSRWLRRSVDHARHQQPRQSCNRLDQREAAVGPTDRDLSIRSPAWYELLALLSLAECAVATAPSTGRDRRARSSHAAAVIRPAGCSSPPRAAHPTAGRRSGR